MAPITRRRFLVALAAALGAGGVGALMSRTAAEPNPIAVSTTTTSPTSTTSTSGATTTPPVAAAPTTASPTTTTLPPGPQVICRDAWGAQPTAGEFARHTIDQITVHHTAVVLGDNSEGPARVRQHQAYHQSRGWPDIAYHFVVDGGGNIYEGRPVDAVGDTGTNYDPTGHLLVCCEGDFNQQEITADQYESLVQMLAWGVVEFGVDPAVIRGHRDLAATSCPGDGLYSLVADGTLSSDVTRATATIGGLQPVCGDAGRQAVAAIEAD